jgi:tocopherol O-methyltransferase
MHHGYYVPETRTDHVQAQIDLIDEVLKWADVSSAQKVVDVGCGIGGSSRHIARLFPNCSTNGITLSPYQANRGNELAKEQKVADRCSFQVADALDMPFNDNSFDLVWSLESGEHMPNKAKFVNELFRVAQPGGRIIIVTWCHRDLGEGEKGLTTKEERLLRKINRAYYLPRWCSVGDYVDLLTQVGAQDIRTEDWSYIIAPFWKAVIRSSLNFKSIWGLLKSGFSTQRGAYAMLLMLRGLNKGLIKFGLITCVKPTATLSEESSPVRSIADVQ